MYIWLFDSHVKFRAKIYTHGRNINKSRRGGYFLCSPGRYLQRTWKICRRNNRDKRLSGFYVTELAPGNFSWSRLGCPDTTVSAAWICLVTDSLTRPDGFPPMLSINGLPVIRTPATQFVNYRPHTYSELELPMYRRIQTNMSNSCNKWYNQICSLICTEYRKIKIWNVTKRV